MPIAMTPPNEGLTTNQHEHASSLWLGSHSPQELPVLILFNAINLLVSKHASGWICPCPLQNVGIFALSHSASEPAACWIPFPKHNRYWKQPLPTSPTILLFSLSNSKLFLLNSIFNSCWRNRSRGQPNPQWDCVFSASYLQTQPSVCHSAKNKAFTESMVVEERAPGQRERWERTTALDMPSLCKEEVSAPTWLQLCLRWHGKYREAPLQASWYLCKL